MGRLTVGVDPGRFLDGDVHCVRRTVHPLRGILILLVHEPEEIPSANWTTLTWS
ncbi:hypothetical protein ACFY0R_17535 [Streptomyces sp. NPDC001633]|uniref:hypothetical protein n=1 Tax=Streptomyces sp. NPDC001633 TaxID=3364595 RepID=UPI00367D115D